MSKQPPPAPTASAVGPYPTVTQIVGRPGAGSLPSTIAPSEYPLKKGNNSANNVNGVTSFNLCQMAGHPLHCTKFREIISSGIKVIERTQFLY